MNSYKVTICLGTETSRLDNNNEGITYSFASEVEKIAFIDGVEAACGWMDYQIVEEEMICNFIPSTEDDPLNPKYSC
jgi:hypothetical protein